MWHVPIPGNDLQPFNRFFIANDIIKVYGPVLLDPSVCPGTVSFNGSQD